jgi:hypothetical protein
MLRSKKGSASDRPADQVKAIIAVVVCRHINAQGENIQLLKWWQATGYKKSPNLRVYKGASSIPQGLLDGMMARGSKKA